MITQGVLTGGTANGIHASATFSGTAFPVSTFFSTAQVIPSQAQNIAPGTVTFAIATTGLQTGYAANTAAAPSTSGVACVVDQAGAPNPPDYEMATYNVVDGTHLTMTLQKPHAALATVAMGGLCGYGVEQTVDTVNGMRQVFPVVGSTSSTGLLYAGGQTGILGVQDQTSGFRNINLAIVAAVRNSNVVTLTVSNTGFPDVTGLTLTVAGMADSSYNGSYVMTTTGSSTLTYANGGANSTSSGGTASYLTGGYALYPMAEVVSVFNTTTKAVDGQLTLAPNTVAWAANDAVEQPHYYQIVVGDDIHLIQQTTPRPNQLQRIGFQYNGNNGPGLQGFEINNATPVSNYLGNGGTHGFPGPAFVTAGSWTRIFEVQTGEEALMRVHCNSKGCNRWNSAYDLFQMDSSGSVDTLNFAPQTSTLNLTMRGTGYSFSPQAFTAGTANITTLNATTINAATINGGFNASSLTSGTVEPGLLPVMGPSGPSHAVGAVPDPGAVAGTTRFLREDGTWVAPAGGGGGGGSGVSSFNGRTGAVLAATGDYGFAQISGSLAAAQVPGLTGDVSAATGSTATVLATVNSTPGACGDASHVCQVTTDAKGRVLSQAAVGIAGGGGGGGGGTVTTFSAGNLGLLFTAAVANAGTTPALSFTPTTGIAQNTVLAGPASGGAGAYGFRALVKADLPGTPAGALVGDTDTQTLTNKTVDGVTPATLGYLDATSSIQTQLNAVVGPGGPLPVLPALNTGLMADYNFYQRSGTSVLDISGNGNNGTFGSSAPTWTATGLAFQPTQGVTLPAALNGSETVIFEVYLNPLTSGTQVTNTYPMLLSSSLGDPGLNLLTDYAVSSSAFAVTGAYTPATYAGGHKSSSKLLLSGFHVIAYELGSGGVDLDHLYVDGAEVAAYSAQGFAQGHQGSGFLSLGSSGVSPWATSGLNGVMYRARFYSTQVSATNIATITQAMQAEAALRGIPTAPVPVQLNNAQLHCVGDSITYGQGASYGFCAQLALTNQPAYTITNWGISGITMQAIVGSEVNRAALRCRSTSGPSVAIAFAGTNDFALVGFTAPLVAANLFGEIQTLKQAGCRVFAGTMISRTGTDGNSSTFDLEKDAYNSLILSQARAAGAEGIVDFAANPLMGADGANASATYFQGDHIHPTNAGQLLLAGAASNALNYYFGATEAAPKVVTALPYAMAAGDGYVSLAGLTNAGALTLPDCTGQSGAVYRVNNPQSTYAATVVGSGSTQPINGLTTSFTVPANGSVALRDIPNARAVGGCHWEM